MLLWVLLILNVVLAVMSATRGVEENLLFSVWVSGYCAATAYALLIIWLFKDKDEVRNANTKQNT